MMGLSPAFLMGCRKAGCARSEFDLSSLRAARRRRLAAARRRASTGSTSSSAPTSCSTSAAAAPTCAPGSSRAARCSRSTAARSSGRCLAVDAAAFDADGRPVVGELGELVIRSPMPSMPVGFWNDPDGERYRAAYFDYFPGVWRHGDWILFTERGSCVITGRSDATLNRGGVRLGTGRVLRGGRGARRGARQPRRAPRGPDGGPGELILFVVLADGRELDDELRTRIAGALRGALSPRHVPDAIEAVPAIPRTLTGKKLELPVKRILLGARPSEVASRDALADPARSTRSSPTRSCATRDPPRRPVAARGRDALRARRLSAVELLAACCERIDERNGGEPTFDGGAGRGQRVGPPVSRDRRRARPGPPTSGSPARARRPDPVRHPDRR